jgi:hypothetical protein
MLKTGASRTDDVVWAAAVAGKNGAGSDMAPGRLMIRGTTGVGRAAGVGAAAERSGLAAGSFAGGGSWADGLGASDCCGSPALRATLAENGVAAGSWEEYAATWLALFGVTKNASIPSKGANPEGISAEAGGARARRSAQ